MDCQLPLSHQKYLAEDQVTFNVRAGMTTSIR